MAQTMRSGSRGAASRGYLMANASFAQIDVVRKQEREFRKKEEEERQKAEQLNLSKAYKIEKARFEAEWVGRVEAVEADCAEKERVLAEVHQIATAASEKEIGSMLAHMKYKASSHLLAMQDTERKLARANEFKEAADVANRCVPNPEPDPNHDPNRRRRQPVSPADGRRRGAVRAHTRAYP